MSRPQKDTADFFYHSATASGEKILYILESEYGNDGYAFWFKLQEALCAEEGHCIEVSSGTTLRFLAARARVSLDAAERMLDLLAEIDAIDSDLWTKQRTIWSQSLIDGLTPLYMKRKSGMPTKPSLMISGDGVSVAEIPVSGAETPVNTDSRHGKTQKPGESGVSGGHNPQSRVEKSREEEKEIKESSSHLPADDEGESSSGSAAEDAPPDAGALEPTRFAESGPEYKLAKYLHDSILTFDPKARKPDLQSWAGHIDKMIRLDKRVPGEIKDMIDFARKDAFWRGNILSTKKLREKATTLIALMQRKGVTGSGTTGRTDGKDNEAPSRTGFDASRFQYTG